MHMKGIKQIERGTTIEVPVEVVYELFMDNAALPEWAPVVDAVLAQDGGDESGVGCTRTCAVTMKGRSGTMIERCVEAVPNSLASFLVVDDSFGFNTMLRDYGFTAHFARTGDDAAFVSIETFYTPANRIAALLNRLIMRRNLRTVVDSLLTGLRASAEQRNRANT
jgi:Polyketide cyclase / dehydrase and lipid transport